MLFYLYVRAAPEVTEKAACGLSTSSIPTTVYPRCHGLFTLAVVHGMPPSATFLTAGGSHGLNGPTLPTRANGLTSRPG